MRVPYCPTCVSTRVVLGDGSCCVCGCTKIQYYSTLEEARAKVLAEGGYYLDDSDPFCTLRVWAGGKYRATIDQPHPPIMKNKSIPFGEKFKSSCPCDLCQGDGEQETNFFPKRRRPMTRLIAAAGIILVGLIPTAIIKDHINSPKPDQSAVVVETPVLKVDEFKKTHWCPGCLEVGVWCNRTACSFCGSTETRWYTWRKVTIENPMFADAIHMYQQSSNGDLHANHKLFDRIPEEFKIEGNDQKLYLRSDVVLTGRPKF